MTTLQDAIHAGLAAALMHCERADVCTFGERGMATGGPDAPVVRLTVKDVARVAARAAEQWSAVQRGPST